MCHAVADVPTLASVCDWSPEESEPSFEKVRPTSKAPISVFDGDFKAAYTDIAVLRKLADKLKNVCTHSKVQYQLNRHFFPLPPLKSLLNPAIEIVVPQVELVLD